MLTAIPLAVSLAGLVKIVLSLALVGFLVWIITTYIPMNELIKKVIYVVVAVVLVLWLLGIIDGGAGDSFLRFS